MYTLSMSQTYCILLMIMSSVYCLICILIAVCDGVGENRLNDCDMKDLVKGTELTRELNPGVKNLSIEISHKM